MPTISPSFSGVREPPGAEHLQVAGHELLAHLAVAAVDGERQQLAVGVGVHIARRVDEVGDVGPPRVVALGDLHGVAEHLTLTLNPSLRDVLDGELALAAAARVDEVLEAVHRHLPEDGRDRIVDPSGEQFEPLRVAAGLRQQPLEHERLSEHRCGLGDRQRRALMKDALLLRQRRVQPVPELVRDRQHVTAARRVVEHHVRDARRTRSRRRRRRACSRARARRSSSRRRSGA